MITFPDFKEKKILFVNGSYKDELSLQFENGSILYLDNYFKKSKITIHQVFAIFIIGKIDITSHLIQKCIENGISIFLLNKSFRIIAEIISQAKGNFTLKEKQYTIDNATCVKIAKKIIKNKINNQNQLIKNSWQNKTTNTYVDLINKLDNITNLNSLRGLEGNFAKAYFKTIFEPYKWYRRTPRAKEDITNFLLDIGYTYIFNFIDSLLNLFGFDTYKGIYHQLFYQRKSLSCDLMEPLRPLIDKQLIKSYNLNQINSEDFIFKNYRFKLKSGKLYVKYSKIWFDLIMKHKVDIYKYIYNYYYYFQQPNKYKYHPFKI